MFKTKQNTKENNCAYLESHTTGNTPRACFQSKELAVRSLSAKLFHATGPAVLKATPPTFLSDG